MRDYFKTILFPNDLRQGNTLHLPSAHSTRYGINSLLFSYSEVIFFRITFLEKLWKASPLKNLRKD